MIKLLKFRILLNSLSLLIYKMQAILIYRKVNIKIS